MNDNKKEKYYGRFHRLLRKQSYATHGLHRTITNNYKKKGDLK